MYGSLPARTRESWLQGQTEACTLLLYRLAALPRPVDRDLVDAVGKAFTSGADAAHTALIERCVRAVAALAGQLEESAVARALAQPTDPAAVVALLGSALPGFPTEPPDPLVAARVRGLKMRDEVLRAEGGTWSVDEVARHLGVTRQAVEKRRAAGKLFALPIGQHRYAYPLWQFTDEGVLPRLDEALAAFVVPGVWTRAAFVLGANALLGGERPLDALRRGDLETFRRAAAAFGQQGST
jgi:hypothetical protein